MQVGSACIYKIKAKVAQIKWGGGGNAVVGGRYRFPNGSGYNMEGRKAGLQ